MQLVGDVTYMLVDPRIDFEARETMTACWILGLKVSPVTARRWRNFRANRRGFWSLIIFLILFGISLPAEFIANDRPIVVSYQDEIYWPVFHDYGEEVFGGVPGLTADFTGSVPPEGTHRGRPVAGWCGRPFRFPMTRW